ncbi:hypothetical protein BXT86_01200 [candidate division WOR-3 bacterium 4484_100]|uniref:Phosphate acetyl/butaryl transferase domain-containing protein n=1 Tax=candidate division WOR-3 bacterium 4484_100 TaxID=1936077 RepID=A0A1V4QGF8_UNCW3|nr:MAG: hypothetical protein BXT86_01200 [candidate division WOR-3 bacterium 4484_100]
MKSFSELIDLARARGKVDCVVVKAGDPNVLEGIRMAWELNLIFPILIDDKKQIQRCAESVHLNLSHIEIIDVADENEAMKKGITVVNERKGILMKGLISTSTFLKGVLNKEWGLRTDRILSHIAVLEIPKYHKLLFMSDGGMNPKLDINLRVKIIANAIELLNGLNITQPKIALISASESVHPDMPETVDAVEIVKMNKNNEISGCIIEGPFGFDVAVSKEAAEHKKLSSQIAGDTDFILMPNISAANIWAKGLIYFAQAQAAGIVMGARRPVVMLSRADKPKTKLNSIALGVAIGNRNQN